MSSVGTANQQLVQRRSEDRGERSTLPTRSQNQGRIPRELITTGLVLLGLGYLAWHFGPDLVRYIKIERM